MSRGTYPAKRSHIAKHDDVQIMIGRIDDFEPVYLNAECAVCEEQLDVGERVIGEFWRGTLTHAACAAAEEAES